MNPHGLLLLATSSLVASQRCPVLVPPPNAETTCSITSSGQEICQIFCHEGLTFASAANNQFTCEQGSWSPPPATLPTCIVKGSLPDGQTITPDFYYPDAIPAEPVCLAWAGQHYRTYDGLMYSFDGGCTYKLTGECEDNGFSVHLNTGSNELRVYFSGQEIVMSNGRIVMGTMSLHEVTIPSVVSGVIFEQNGPTTIVNLFDTIIRWDGSDGYVIEPSDALKGRACGLCGNFDQNAKNDRITMDGKTTESALVLGNSWQMPHPEDECTPTLHQHHQCTTRSAQELDIARGKCAQLRSLEFIDANQAVDPEAWIQVCVNDFCLGRDGFCSTATQYFREVSRHGTHIEWRTATRCPAQCAPSFVYKQCGSGCQQTCERHAFKCDSTCVDGCHCPDGFVLHNNECIKPSQCPCYSHGEEYKPGSSIKQDCNTCFCESGDWSCTEMECQSVCKVAGVNHFTTFDGTQFDFVGECAYTLVEPTQLGKGEAPWAIFVKFDKCEQHVELLCHKSLEIRLGDDYVTMGAGFVTTVNDKVITSYPTTVSDAVIEMSSNVVQRIQLAVGITVYWNGKDRIYVHAAHQLRDQVAGLCGTLNHRQGDDFRVPDGALAQSPAEFGNEWRGLDICPLVAEHERGRVHPCEAYVEVKSSALASCASLMSAPFDACHNVVSVEPFYRACTYDYCACASVSMAQDGACGAIADYARSCAKAGVQLDVSTVAECMPKCPGQTVWNQCAPMDEQLHCGAAATTTDITCIEGCFCPDGLMLDRDGETCVNIDQCTCHHNGSLVESGTTKSEGCLKCSCNNGEWDCVADKATCLENQVCPAGMEWVECKGCQQHCSNMHIQDDKECSKKECEAGCQCKEGLVYANGECVQANQCPCFHGGQSYSLGQVISTECEDCVCNDQGNFDCATKPCWGTCSVYGDPHYTTFDGKRYEFQGSCSYVFAQTNEKWNGVGWMIASKNIPCGSSGVTCTRDIELNYNGTSIQINKHSDLNNLSLPSLCTSWESGLFSFIKCNEDFLLKWDRGTRLSVSLAPKHKSFVEGLCGNYNDDQADDFTTPSKGPPEQVPSVFGDSWKLYGYCPKAKPVIDTCQLHPHRHQWAQSTCSVIRSSIFSSCHHEVAPIPYYEACVFDACGCDSGGDCECACTAIAAYAQVCAKRNVVVEWRSEERCPMQCGNCPSEFNSCLDACPKTCQNRFEYEQLSKNCNAGECVEGCTCGNGTLWDENINQCVTENDCTCGRMNGVLYQEGEFIPALSDDCQKCFCVNGGYNCIGEPCVDIETTTKKINEATTTQKTTTQRRTSTVDTTTTVPITETTTSATTTRGSLTTTTHIPTSTVRTSTLATTTTGQSVTTPMTQDLTEYCADSTDYWTPWMNVNYPSSKTDGDSEGIDIARKSYVFCPKTMISDIECRSVSGDSGPHSCTIDGGLVCLNAQQLNGVCDDYEVRFYCACGPSSTTSTPISTTEAPKTDDCSQSDAMKITMTAMNTLDSFDDVGVESSGWRGFPLDTSQLTVASHGTEFAAFISVEKVVIVANQFGEYPTSVTFVSELGKETLEITSVPYAHKMEKSINALSFKIIINSYKGANPSLKIGFFGKCPTVTSTLNPTNTQSTTTQCADECILRCSDLCHGTLMEYQSETSSCADINACLKWENCGTSLCETGYKFNGDKCIKENTCPCKVGDVIISNGDALVDDECTHVCSMNTLSCKEPEMTTAQSGCYVNGELVKLNTAWSGQCGTCYCAQTGVVCDECTTTVPITTTVDYSTPKETTLTSSGPTKTTTQTFTDSPAGEITTITSTTNGYSTTSTNPTVVTRTTSTQDGTTISDQTTTEDAVSTTTQTTTYAPDGTTLETRTTSFTTSDDKATVTGTTSLTTRDNLTTEVVTTTVTATPDKQTTTSTIEAETTTNMSSTKYVNGTTTMTVTKESPTTETTKRIVKTTTPVVTDNVVSEITTIATETTTIDIATGVTTEFVTTETTEELEKTTEKVTTTTPLGTTTETRQTTPSQTIMITTTEVPESTTVRKTTSELLTTGPITTTEVILTTENETTTTRTVATDSTSRTTTVSTQGSTIETSEVAYSKTPTSSILTTAGPTKMTETTKSFTSKDGSSTTQSTTYTTIGSTNDVKTTEKINEEITTVLSTGGTKTTLQTNTIDITTPTRSTTTRSVTGDVSTGVTEIVKSTTTVEPKTTSDFTVTGKVTAEQTTTTSTSGETTTSVVKTTYPATDIGTTETVTVTEEELLTTRPGQSTTLSTVSVTKTDGTTKSVTTEGSSTGSTRTTTTSVTKDVSETSTVQTSPDTSTVVKTTTRVVTNPDLTTTTTVTETVTDGDKLTSTTVSEETSTISESTPAVTTTVAFTTESDATTTYTSTQRQTDTMTTKLVSEVSTTPSVIELTTTEFLTTTKPDGSVTTTEKLTTELISKTAPTSVVTEQNEDCYIWDEWQNNNVWSNGNERESLRNYMENSVCVDVVAIECRSVRSGQFSYELNPDSTCNVESGLTCVAEDFGFDLFNNNQCVDYEIRIKCTDVSKSECYSMPESTTRPTETTTTTTTLPVTTSKSDETVTSKQLYTTTTESTDADTTTVFVTETTETTPEAVVTKTETTSEGPTETITTSVTVTNKPGETTTERVTVTGNTTRSEQTTTTVDSTDNVVTETTIRSETPTTTEFITKTTTTDSTTGDVVTESKMTTTNKETGLTTIETTSQTDNIVTTVSTTSDGQTTVSSTKSYTPTSSKSFTTNSPSTVSEITERVTTPESIVETTRQVTETTLVVDDTVTSEQVSTTTTTAINTDGTTQSTITETSSVSTESETTDVTSTTIGDSTTTTSVTEKFTTVSPRVTENYTVNTATDAVQTTTVERTTTEGLETESTTVMTTFGATDPTTGTSVVVTEAATTRGLDTTFSTTISTKPLATTENELLGSTTRLSSTTTPTSETQTTTAKIINPDLTTTEVVTTTEKTTNPDLSTTEVVTTTSVTDGQTTTITKETTNMPTQSTQTTTEKIINPDLTTTEVIKTTKKTTNPDLTTTDVVTTIFVEDGKTTTQKVETTVAPTKTTRVTKTEADNATTVETFVSTTALLPNNTMRKTTDMTTVSTSEGVETTTRITKLTETTPDVIITTTKTEMTTSKPTGTVSESTTFETVTTTPSTIITRTTTETDDVTTVATTEVNITDGLTTTTDTTRETTDNTTGVTTIVQSTTTPSASTTTLVTENLEESTTTTRSVTGTPLSTTIIATEPTVKTVTTQTRTTPSFTSEITETVYETTGVTKETEPATEIVTTTVTVTRTDETTIIDEQQSTTVVTPTKVVSTTNDSDLITTTESISTTTLVQPTTTSDYTVAVSTTAQQTTETVVTTKPSGEVSTTLLVSTSFPATETTTGEIVTVTESEKTTTDHEGTTAVTSTTVVQTDGTTKSVIVTETPLETTTETVTETTGLTTSIMTTSESPVVTATTTRSVDNPDLTTTVTTTENVTDGDDTISTKTVEVTTAPAATPQWTTFTSKKAVTPTTVSSTTAALTTEPSQTVTTTTVAAGDKTTTTVEKSTYSPTTGSMVTVTETLTTNVTSGVSSTMPVQSTTTLVSKPIMTTTAAPTCTHCLNGVAVGSVFDAAEVCSRSVCNADCTYSDVSPTSKECVVTKMEQIYTFDDLELNYDLCSHVIARDCENAAFEVSLSQSCEDSVCNRVTEIILGDMSFKFQPESRQFDVNSHQYDMDSITALNDVLLEKNGIQIENYGFGMALISQDVQVLHYLNGDLKVTISDKYFGKTCGMCGNSNCESNDDRLEETQASSIPPSTYDLGEQSCTPEQNFTCPDEMTGQANEICNQLKNDMFSSCHSSMSMESYLNLCASEACDCLKSGFSSDECKCNAITAFVESCQKQTKTCAYSQWRSAFSCSTPECPAGKVYRECGDACPRSCKDILSDDKMCPVTYSQPGCFCPDGYVTQGDRCIKEEECKCVCRGWGDPHYRTYDKKYFPYQGDCTYVLSRPLVNRDFEIFGHNEYCVTAPEATCTKAVTVRIGNDVITLMDDLRIIVNGVQLVQTQETTTLDNGNINIEQFYGRHLLLTVENLQIQVMYDQLTMGFAIAVPVLTYSGKLEGLCGDCNYDPTDDNISPTGDEIVDLSEFVASWKLRNECANEDDFLCDTCQETIVTTPAPEINSTCTQKCDILSDPMFDSCRQIVDFAPYYDSCLFDSCSGMKSCYSIAAVADECRKMGICIDWRSKSVDECEVECGVDRVYSHCDNSCNNVPHTCADAKATTMSACTFTESCICPGGKVEHDGECIDVRMCPSCLDIYPEGAVWRNETDPCIEYTCVDGQVKSTEFACECLVQPECGDYEDLVTVRDDDSCCSTYECKCNISKCPEEPVCEQGAVLRRITTDCCPEYVCLAPTCGVVEKQRVFEVEDCTTVTPVTVTVCEGSCSSTTALMETFSAVEADRSCSCCSGVEFETVNVELLCPGDFQVSHQMQRITKCLCNATTCGGD